MKKITRALFLVLAVLTALTVVVTAYDLTTFKDYNKDHWANVALSHAVDNKLLGGYDDNTIRKDRALTRAEMATVINRAFGASVHGPVTQFTDLKATDWYYNEIAKAVQMQTFGGTGSKIEADRAIFREEAMIVIARAMVLKDGNTEVLEKYNDYNEVSPWATGAIAALVEKGYVNGTNMNLVEPKAVVTRAQFAQIMYNIFSDYIQTVRSSLNHTEFFFYHSLISALHSNIQCFSSCRAKVVFSKSSKRCIIFIVSRIMSENARDKFFSVSFNIKSDTTILHNVLTSCILTIYVYKYCIRISIVIVSDNVKPVETCRISKSIFKVVFRRIHNLNSLCVIYSYDSVRSNCIYLIFVEPLKYRTFYCYIRLFNLNHINGVLIEIESVIHL